MHLHDDERFAADAPNYQFLRWAMTGGLLGRPARVLDFGCGRGQLVRLAAEAGVGIEGADTYAGGYEAWRAQLPGDIAARIHRIENGRLPFEDAHFDAIVSNQVFEHIADPRPALAEIARVLKPGGLFLALFPTRDVWYEGHVGLYFAHWLEGDARETWLRNAHRLGFGYHRGHGEDAATWARYRAATLAADVHYHAIADVRRWWREAFGAAPSSAAAAFMRFRLRTAPGFAPLAPLAAALEAVCHLRAGRVLLTQKAAIPPLQQRVA